MNAYSAGGALYLMRHECIEEALRLQHLRLETQLNRSITVHVSILSGMVWCGVAVLDKSYIDKIDAKPTAPLWHATLISFSCTK